MDQQNGAEMLDYEYVKQREQELREQGRWEERARLLVDYVQSHPGILKAVIEGEEAYQRGEYISFRELIEQERRAGKSV